MFLTVNYFVGKLTIPTDYMEEMWIRRKVKFLKTYDVNPSRLSHCVFFFCKLLSLFPHLCLSRIPNQKVFIVVVRICIFLQSSPPIVPLICVPLTVNANGVSSVAVRLSPSHHSRHRGSVVRLLFLSFLHGQSAQTGIALYFYLELLSVKW